MAYDSPLNTLRDWRNGLYLNGGGGPFLKIDVSVPVKSACRENPKYKHMFLCCLHSPFQLVRKTYNECT